MRFSLQSAGIAGGIATRPASCLNLLTRVVEKRFPAARTVVGLIPVSTSELSLSVHRRPKLDGKTSARTLEV